MTHMKLLQKIEAKIKNNLQCLHCHVVNESHMHSSVPKNSETHFRIEIVSNAFENKSLLQRHRFINELLQEEFSFIKACSLHTLTEKEWEKKNLKIEKSPSCAGR